MKRGYGQYGHLHIDAKEYCNIVDHQPIQPILSPRPCLPDKLQDAAQQKVKMLQEELDTAKSDAARTSQKLQSFQQAKAVSVRFFEQLDQEKSEYTV